MKFHLISLGCQMNISDSERIKTVLFGMGFEETEVEEDAQIVGVVACSVRQKAIDKIYALIHKWERWQKKRSLVTFVSGCILPSDREKFLKRFDLLFSINELPQLPQALQQYGITTPYSSMHNTPIDESTTQEQNTRSVLTPTSQLDEKSSDIARGFWQIAPSYSSNFEAFVTIQNGCDKFCTFCAVPYTRGREVSRSSSEILREIYSLMQSGYKSISLLGQNVNSYGLDTNGNELNFAQLLERIGNMAEELQHECWIYFTSPHPRDMTREVLEVIARYPCLANQINLPLQSGDDKLLLKMNRAHSMKRYDEVVSLIRSILPDATLFTDIIVGFCGETDEQFQNTAKAMRKYQYNMAYIAMYSPRPGATSSRWNDDVALDLKKTRFRALSDILVETSRAYNDTLFASRVKLLVEKSRRIESLPPYIATKDYAKEYSLILLSAKTEGKIPVQLYVPHSLIHMTTENADVSQIEDEFMRIHEGQFVYAKVKDTHSLSLICELQAGNTQ